MKLKQTLLGFGLATLLGSCEDKLNHYTYGGKIACVDNSPETTGVCMENEATGSVGYLVIENERITQDLKDRLEVGRKLRVQDCEVEFKKIKDKTIYLIKNCRFYR